MRPFAQTGVSSWAERIFPAVLTDLRLRLKLGLDRLRIGPEIFDPLGRLDQRMPALAGVLKIDFDGSGRRAELMAKLEVA